MLKVITNTPSTTSQIKTNKTSESNEARESRAIQSKTTSSNTPENTITKANDSQSGKRAEIAIAEAYVHNKIMAVDNKENTPYVFQKSSPFFGSLDSPAKTSGIRFTNTNQADGPASNTVYFHEDFVYKFFKQHVGDDPAKKANLLDIFHRKNEEVAAKEAEGFCRYYSRELKEATDMVKIVKMPLQPGGDLHVVLITPKIKGVTIDKILEQKNSDPTMAAMAHEMEKDLPKLSLIADRLKNRKLVHGDMRAQNILYDQDSHRFHLIDFDNSMLTPSTEGKRDDLNKLAGIEKAITK